MKFLSPDGYRGKKFTSNPWAVFTRRFHKFDDVFVSEVLDLQKRKLKDNTIAERSQGNICWFRMRESFAGIMDGVITHQ
jgi:hypothetical protein